MENNISPLLIKNFNLRYTNNNNNTLTLGDDKSIIIFLIKNLNSRNYQNLLEDLIFPLGNFECLCFNFLQMVINTGFIDYYVGIINCINNKCEKSLRIMINNFFLNEKKHLDILQKLCKDILIKEYFDYLIETKNYYNLNYIKDKTDNLNVKNYIIDILYKAIVEENKNNNED